MEVKIDIGNVKYIVNNFSEFTKRLQKIIGLKYSLLITILDLQKRQCAIIPSKGDGKYAKGR